MSIVDAGLLVPGLAALAGAVFGVFAARVADRWPRGEPVMRPAPRADRPAAVDGFLIGCACVLVAAGVAVLFGVTWEALAVAALALVLVPVVVIDLRHRLIPDMLVLPAAAVALVAATLSHPARWWCPVLAALGAGGFMLMLWLVHPSGMGLGDVKLAALMGAALGPSVIAALGIAFTGGALLGAVMVARMGARARAMAVPFGPFLAAGAIASLWLGEPLLRWYVASLA
jgi:leader peptidase (prepilin peptidase)/N-methyltransferase